MPIAVSLSMLMFYALALVVQYGYSYGAIALLVLSFIALFLPKNEQSIEIKHFYLPLTLILSFFAVQLADILLHDLTLRFFDKPSRFLLAALILILLAKFPPKKSYFFGGVILGAIGSAVLGLYEVYQLGIDRAQGYEHPIQFGDISMLLGVFCLAGLIWAKHQNLRWLWTVLLMLGFIAGVLGSLLSQSRGGWLILPLLIVLYPICFSHHFSIKKLIIFIAASLLGLASLYLIPQTNVKNKINYIIVDINRYQQGYELGSLAARFVMWKTAVELIKQKPVFGWGEQAYLQEIANKIEGNELDPYFKKFNHAHNDYIDALVKRGVIGLAALLILYVGFFIYFFKYIQHAYYAVRAIAFAGVLLIASYASFGLSQSFLMHNSGVMMLAFSLIFLSSLLQSALQFYNSNYMR